MFYLWILLGCLKKWINIIKVQLITQLLLMITTRYVFGLFEYKPSFKNLGSLFTFLQFNVLLNLFLTLSNADIFFPFLSEKLPGWSPALDLSFLPVAKIVPLLQLLVLCILFKITPLIVKHSLNLNLSPITPEGETYHQKCFTNWPMVLIQSFCDKK